MFQDLELLRYMFFVVRSNDSFNFPLGWIKFIVIVAVVIVAEGSELSSKPSNKDEGNRVS